jgi:hypothetical protein
MSDLDNQVFVLFRKYADSLGFMHTVYPTFSAAKKAAAVDGGFIVQAYKVEKAAIVKKRKETQIGEKKPVSILVLDSPEERK